MVDTSERKPVYLLRRPSGAYLRLSPTVYHILRWRLAGVPSPEIARRLDATGGHVTDAEVDAAHERIVERIKHIDRNFSPTFFGMWVRATLLPGPVVERLAEVLAPAYRIPWPIVLLGLVGLAVMRAVSYDYMIDPVSSGFWIAYLLLVLSLFVHEFGHASACARFGARAGDIGAAIYLVYPAFYANVSSAWGLSRAKRLIVNAGGLYFQFITGAVYIGLYELTSWPPLKLAALGIAVNGVIMLNPIFRFDGYWLLSDALGVTNLSRQPPRVARHWLDRLRGRNPTPLPWPAPVRAILGLYSAVLLGGWTAFLALLLPRLWDRYLSTYPALATELLRDLLATPGSVGSERIRTFLTASFFMGMGLFIAWRSYRQLFVRSLLPRLRQRLRATRQS